MADAARSGSSASVPSDTATTPGCEPMTARGRGTNAVGSDGVPTLRSTASTSSAGTPRGLQSTAPPKTDFAVRSTKSAS